MLLPCRTAPCVRTKICERLLDHLGARHDILHDTLAGPALTGEVDVLTQLTEASVPQIRKTDETPPRVSVYDTLRVLLGIQQDMCSSTLQRLFQAHEEVRALCSNFKFDGRGVRS